MAWPLASARIGEQPQRRSYPERVGRYDLVLPIGSGGMGIVYLARAHGVGGFRRDVALKLIHPHLRQEMAGSMQRQLMEEAWLAARIRHPNVAAVIDVGQDPSGLFLVMEYVEGDTLWTLFQDAVRDGRRLPTPIALRILVDALAGLHAAHELRGEDGAALYIVHRDFSPQNILVGVADGYSRLTDFGIAKSTRSSATQTGLIKGKPCYMAPEQALGLPVDRRCDVWAAAVVAWELFSGARLYSSEEQAYTLLRVVSEDAPRLRSVWPDAPAELDQCLAEGLHRDREQRLPTAETLRTRLLASVGCSAADPAEVAEYVSSCVGGKIEARRRNALTFLGRPFSDDPEMVATLDRVATDPRRRKVGRLAYALTAGLAFALTLEVTVTRHGRAASAETRSAPAPSAARPPNPRSSARSDPTDAVTSQRTDLFAMAAGGETLASACGRSALAIAEPPTGALPARARAGGGDPATATTHQASESHGTPQDLRRTGSRAAGKSVVSVESPNPPRRPEPPPSAPPPAVSPLLEDSLDAPQ